MAGVVSGLALHRAQTRLYRIGGIGRCGGHLKITDLATLNVDHGEVRERPAHVNANANHSSCEPLLDIQKSIQ